MRVGHKLSQGGLGTFFHFKALKFYLERNEKTL